MYSARNHKVTSTYDRKEVTKGKRPIISQESKDN